MKNKNLKIISILLIFAISLIAIFGTVNAENDNLQNVQSVEYTEDYKKWLELPEEERSNTLMPKMYNVEQESISDYLKTNTALRVSSLLKASSDTRFDYRDIISSNLKIKNQGITKTCWAFASLSALETTLAYTDYKNSVTPIEYDYSVRHMDYSTIREAFLNNAINEKGFNRILSEGGSDQIALAYLTNGSGAIPESEMEFENNINNIDINLLNNKTVSTHLYDTQEFSDPGTDLAKIEETKLKIKEHISNYGGVFTGILGPTTLTSDFFNNTTGALYSNDTTETRDHAVNIIGWDDDYNVDNFNTNNQPTNNGAWIAKNSYGETVGDNGFIYISYEDVNVYKQLWGIKKAVASKDYKNIYQNDLLGASRNVEINNESLRKVYIANVFTRDSSIEEAVDKISIYTFSKYDNVKVYINPNDSNKSKESLKEVELVNGNTAEVDVGYHTLEFKNPVNLKGSSFAIVIEIECNGTVELAIESKISGTIFSDAEVSQNESFYTSETSFNQNVWQDLAETGSESTNGNLCIKAFTTNAVAEPEEPTQPTDPTEPEQPEVPQTPETTVSDFKDMIANITDLRGYTYTDSSKESYCTMKVKIDNIKISDEDNKYYYYISENKNLNNTDTINWVEVSANDIQKNADGTYTALIDVDTRNLSNLENLTEAKEMYLYIKQIDKNNNQIIENTLLGEPEDGVFYVDDVEIGNIETIVEKITEEITNYASSINSQGSNEDTTTANTVLPKAGKISILITIIIIAMVGVIAFIKIKNIDK